MATTPQIIEDPSRNSITDEETIALKKKRSRRVSFADREITSVHIFNRDDEYETPPDSASTKNPNFDPDDEVRAFFSELAGSDDSKEMLSPTGADVDGNDDSIDSRKSFFRPTESSSPGSSSIVGSATSNDEDNFFGPVSASFIRAGRLSDSGVSDCDVDVTMDSAAFSMHYRSLVRSSLREGLKTSTELRVTSEERTPSIVTTPSDPGSLMVLMKDKKVISRNPSGFVVDSGGRDSNDMSLVGENSRSYGYDKLSPGLEALLTEAMMEPQPASAFLSNSSNVKFLERSEVSMFDENGSSYMDNKDCKDKERGKVDVLDISAKGISVANDGNGNCVSTLADQCTSPLRTEGVVVDGFIHHRVQSPTQPGKLQTADQPDGLQALNQMSKVQTPNQMSKLQTPNQSGGVQTPNQLSKVQTPKQMSELVTPNQTDVVQMPNQLSKVRTPNQMSKLLTPNEPGGVQTPNHLSKVQTPNQTCKLQTPNPVVPVNNDYHKVAIAMDVELPASSIGIASDVDTQVLTLSSLKKHESGQCSDDILKENFADRRNYYNTDHNSDQLHGSISSLSAKKRQHIFLDASKSSRQLSYATPSPKQTDPFLRKENLKSSGIQLSPLESSLNDRIEHSRLRISKFISSAMSFNSVMDANSKADTAGKQVNAPVMNLEKCFSSIDRKDRDHEKLRTIDCYNAVPPSDVDDLTNSGGTISLSEDGESFMHTSAHILSKEREVRPHILAEKPVDRTSFIPGSGPSPAEIKMDFRNLIKTINEPDNFVPPSLEVLDQGLKDSISVGTKQQLTSDELVCLGSNQDKNSAGNVYSRRCSTAVTDGLVSLFSERSPQSGSFLLDIHHSGDSSQDKLLDDEQSYLPNNHGASKSSLTFQTSLRERNASNIHSGSPDRNILIVSPDPSHSEEELDGERNKSSLQASASLYNSNNDIQSSFARKRRIEESILEDAEHAEEVRRIKRSVDNRNPHSDRELMLECSNGSINDSEMVIGDLTVRHWTDIALKFSGDTNQMLSPLTDKLNIKMIGMLQDFLVHLQRVKKLEMLRSQIQPQKKCDMSSEVRNKRIDETRLVLSKLVFERARLQLMSVERVKLLKRAQKLSSAIEEFKILKSNSILHPSMPSEVPDKLQNSCTSKYGRKIEGSNEKVVTMRDEYEALDRNIKSLAKSFHSRFKMKGEPSCTETIVLVNDHLRRRTSCRFLCQDLQLWEVEDLSSRNGQQNIVLNYQGFISQRFVINAVPSRSLFIANQLNYTTITKIFPNMDACLAFSYALNSETNKKYLGTKSLAQETQVTSSLLRNLLDVIDEVQRSRIEIRNLINTSFSSSVEKLDLLLCFIDFNTGWRVTVTLDMTCLNRGIYPSAVVPYQLHASTNGTHKLLPESLSAQVKAAVDNLRIGFSRIVRLCKCVSQVVQSLST